MQVHNFYHVNGVEIAVAAKALWRGAWWRRWEHQQRASPRAGAAVLRWVALRAEVGKG